MRGRFFLPCRWLALPFGLMQRGPVLRNPGRRRLLPRMRGLVREAPWRENVARRRRTCTTGPESDLSTCRSHPRDCMSPVWGPVKGTQRPRRGLCGGRSEVKRESKPAAANVRVAIFRYPPGRASRYLSTGSGMHAPYRDRPPMFHVTPHYKWACLPVDNDKQTRANLASGLVGCDEARFNGSLQHVIHNRRTQTYRCGQRT